ncbi:hypothetical protein [Kiloniella sp.]|uniref:hypothetical protein n=1 Tax=Kiloniella sp. TaxID=1938587 RepID=UPI003A8CDF5A
MFRIAIIIVGIVITLSGCNKRQLNLTGSGPIELSPEIKVAYQKYLENEPVIFSVSTDGTSSWYGVNCDHGDCRRKANKLKYYANGACVNKAGGFLNPEGIVCKVYDIGGKVVWDRSGHRIDDKAKVEEQVVNFNGKLTEGQKKSFDVYQSRISIKNPELTFVYAVSNNGANSFAYSKEAAPHKDLKDRVIRYCEVKSNGQPCFLYAVNDKIVVHK